MTSSPVSRLIATLWERTWPIRRPVIDRIEYNFRLWFARAAAETAAGTAPRMEGGPSVEGGPPFAFEPLSGDLRAVVGALDAVTSELEAAADHLGAMVLQRPARRSAATPGPLEVTVAGWPGLHDVFAAVVRANGRAASVTVRDEEVVPPAPVSQPGSARTLLAVGPAAAFDAVEPGAGCLAGWDGVVTADAPLEASATLAHLLGVSYLPELPATAADTWRLSEEERGAVRAAAATTWDGTVREMVAALGQLFESD
ncbi:MAG: hypothetical protein IT302_02455 [Dehalococcoidia bacterium]|nr:hypothetical protein [Dehalococcoidia bacterium]